MKLRLVVDLALCVGSRTCELVAPDHFAVGEDGKSNPALGDVAETPDLIEAIESCPAGAISAVDPATGATVHPSW